MGSFVKRRLVALVAGAFGLAGAAFADPAVVEAYRAIRASGVAPDLTYELRAGPGGFVTTSPDWGTDIPVEVDAANGWLRIADEGTGAGLYETQIVLWRQTGGTPLVGIAETLFEPPYPGATRVRFFGEEGANWGEWTAYVWPAPELADFLPDDLTIADLRALRATRAAIYVTLPRHGLDARAQLVTRDEEIRAVCGGEDWFVPADPAAYLRYCARVAGRLGREIPLRWIREEGRFEAGAAR